MTKDAFCNCGWPGTARGDARPTKALGRELKEKIANRLGDPWTHVKADGAVVRAEDSTLRLEIIRGCSDVNRLRAMAADRDAQVAVRKLAEARARLLQRLLTADARKSTRISPVVKYSG